MIHARLQGLRSACGITPAIALICALGMPLGPSAAAAPADGVAPNDAVKPGADIPSAGPYAPEWDSLKHYQCPEWFRDAKFGIWAHWGPQSVPEQGDWYARKMYVEGDPANKYHVAHYGHPSQFGYKDIIPLWKAEKFDPDALMEKYVRAGAKYFVSMGVHHDNFDLWNSKHHRWNAVNMGPKKDIVGLWATAARKRGLRFGVSEHLERSYSWFNTNKGADRQGPKAGVPYDGNDPKFADLYFPPHPDNNRQYPVNPPEWWQKEWLARITDLVDSYQPDLLYTDGGVPFGTVGRQLIAHFYNENMRWHGGRLEAVYNIKRANDKNHGDYVDGIAVEDLERGTLNGIKAEPWQTDTSIADWFYSHNYKFKTTAEVIHLLADIVSKNGNLLINFTQRPDGSLDPESDRVLDELAVWMPVNGEAIFGTRPWKVFGEGPHMAEAGHFAESKTKFTAEDIRFTRKGDVIYAIVLGWPGDGADITIQSFSKANGVSAPKSVMLLGQSTPLKFETTDAGLRVHLPDRAPSHYAVVLKVQ